MQNEQLRAQLAESEQRNLNLLTETAQIEKALEDERHEAARAAEMRQKKQIEEEEESRVQQRRRKFVEKQATYLSSVCIGCCCVPFALLSSLHFNFIWM